MEHLNLNANKCLYHHKYRSALLLHHHYFWWLNLASVMFGYVLQCFMTTLPLIYGCSLWQSNGFKRRKCQFFKTIFLHDQDSHSNIARLMKFLAKLHYHELTEFLISFLEENVIMHLILLVRYLIKILVDSWQSSFG